MQGLRTLAASNVGVKSEAFETAFPRIKKEKPQLTNEKAIDKLHTYMQKIADELGVPFTQVQAMASADRLTESCLIILYNTLVNRISTRWYSIGCFLMLI